LLNAWVFLQSLQNAIRILVVPYVSFYNAAVVNRDDRIGSWIVKSNW
jgi:hypothetical protein